MLDKTIRRQLGYLLWLERGIQEKEIRWVVKKMKTEISSVDFAEHGKGHMNWNFYQRLLDNIKCANHWLPPVESGFQADSLSDWQA